MGACQSAKNRAAMTLGFPQKSNVNKNKTDVIKIPNNKVPLKRDNSNSNTKKRTPDVTLVKQQRKDNSIDAIPEYERNDRIKFEDLVFLENMDEGSFGEVFHGTLWGQDVAIKRMRLNGKDSDAYKLLQHEVSMLRSVGHPNIVQYLGACFEKEHCCIVTEYVPSGSLERMLKETTKMSLGKYLKIAIGIASGLNWLHHRKIIHRDLKPSNILVGKHEVVKICDLGLSHTKRSGNRPGTYGLAGTMCYMAPEVLKSQRYSYPADIYSLGIILCQIATGRQPYEAMGILSTPSGNDLLEAVSDGVRPLMRKDAAKMGLSSLVDWGTTDGFMPIALESLIHECWHEDPKRRPSAQNVLTRLRAVAKKVEEEQEYQREHLEEMNIPPSVQALINDSKLRVEELERALTETLRTRDQERANLIAQIREVQNRLFYYEHVVPPGLYPMDTNSYQMPPVGYPSSIVSTNSYQTSFSGNSQHVSRAPSSRDTGPESPFIYDIEPHSARSVSYRSTTTPMGSVIAYNEPQSGVSQYAYYENEPSSAKTEPRQYQYYNVRENDSYSNPMKRSPSANELHMDMYDAELDGYDPRIQQSSQSQPQQQNQDGILPSDFYYSYNGMSAPHMLYSYGMSNSQYPNQQQIYNSFSTPDNLNYVQHRNSMPALNRPRSDFLYGRYTTNQMYMPTQYNYSTGGRPPATPSPKSAKSLLSEKSDRRSRRRKSKRKSRRRAKERKRKDTERHDKSSSKSSLHVPKSNGAPQRARSFSTAEMERKLDHTQYSYPNMYQSTNMYQYTAPHSAHDTSSMRHNNMYHNYQYLSPLPTTKSPISRKQKLSPIRKSPVRPKSVSPANNHPRQNMMANNNGNSNNNNNNNNISKNNANTTTTANTNNDNNVNNQQQQLKQLQKQLQLQHIRVDNVSEEAMKRAKARSRKFKLEQQQQRGPLFKPPDQINRFQYIKPMSSTSPVLRPTYPNHVSKSFERSFERLSNVDEQDERLSSGVTSEQSFAVMSGSSNKNSTKSSNPPSINEIKEIVEE